MRTIKVTKFALISNDDKRMQTLDCKKTFSYGKSNKIVDKNDEINKKKKIQKYKQH